MTDAVLPQKALANLERDIAVIEATEALERFARRSPEGAAWAAYNWLHINDAGLPVVSFIDNQARQDARFWAETATPAELECYAFAALERLADAPFSGRQIKRMVATLWRRMSPTEQEAFKGWINK